MDFSGKVAAITGGASGMGAATVKAYTSAGGKAVIIDRNVALATQVAEDTGAGVFTGNVADSEFCNWAIEQVIEEHGRIDTLVNAAGVIARASGLQTSDEAWERVMGVNVNGTFFMCRATIPHMQKQGGGAIINFGSIWGDVGAAGVLAYCASKGAVHNMTRAMALDHATENIRVNAVCPGEVNTPMLQSERSEPVTEEMLQRLAQTVPMARLAEPMEIAQVVLFLASDNASYMTGSLVTVDAGFTAR